MAHSSATDTDPVSCSLSASRPISAGLDLHGAELQDRDEAEERGRWSMEAILESLNPRNGLGDFDKQGKDEGNGPEDPGASAKQDLSIHRWTRFW
jgi:hypothetical protein